ncbi:MAG: NUDIX hydrolase [Gammaproteobacteria bacterium]|nr:NUDIX hydrolase [Gammaproteobacteria bacterium]NND54641.1 NUDIX hydrolase [Gammaproteobacteria bacterium]
MTTASPNTRPLGRPIRFCSACGAEVTIARPEGDHQFRYVCTACAEVHYENPKVVVGCVAEHEGGILLCKRAIPPRRGYWTLPAGFMELGESMSHGAARETREEACADVTIGALLASVNILSAGQVHVFFRAVLPRPEFASGPESLDVQLVAPNDLPWDEMAFTSNRIALEQYLWQERTGRRFVWTGNAL